MIKHTSRNVICLHFGKSFQNENLVSATAALPLPFQNINKTSKTSQNYFPTISSVSKLLFAYRMPSVGVKDVDQQKFTAALAAFLKK